MAFTFRIDPNASAASVNNGFADSKAETCTKCGKVVSRDYFLNTEKIPLSELSRMVMAGEIDDAKTIGAVLKAEKYLSERAAK